VSQILAHLPGMQNLAFSPEWKTFYDGNYPQFFDGASEEEKICRGLSKTTSVSQILQRVP